MYLYMNIVYFLYMNIVYIYIPILYVVYTWHCMYSYTNIYYIHNVRNLRNHITGADGTYHIHTISKLPNK